MNLQELKSVKETYDTFGPSFLSRETMTELFAIAEASLSAPVEVEPVPEAQAVASPLRKRTKSA